MPKFHPTVRPDLFYYATHENHDQIEAFLARLEASEQGRGALAIHQLIDPENAGSTKPKGRAILDALTRSFPAYAPAPTPDPDAELVDVSMLLAETFILTEDDRSASAIFDLLTEREQLPAEENGVLADTLALMEENIDRALTREDAADAESRRQQARWDWLADQPI